MSKDKNQTNGTHAKGQGGTIALGILSILIVVGIFFAILTTAYQSGRTGGQITADVETLRRGTETEFCFTPTDKFADGTRVKWYADGQQIAENTMSQNTAKLRYTPQKTGKIVLQVQTADKFSDNVVFEVQRPELTLTAPNITVTYGEKLPDVIADCSGFAAGECPDCVAEHADGCDDCTDKSNADCENCRLNLSCRLTDSDDKDIDVKSGRLPVGQYLLRADCNQTYLDYDTKTVDGTLQVLPRRVCFADITKVYDGTNKIDPAAVKLSGVLPDDEVNFSFLSATTVDKNVGTNKQTTLDGLSFSGADAGNYTFCKTPSVTIVPCKLTLLGTVVADKIYDGTTKAKIKTLGKLSGVKDGDSVAIGSVSANFAQADVGNNISVRLNGVTLVGIGKENYEFVCPADLKADITNK